MSGGVSPPGSGAPIIRPLARAGRTTRDPQHHFYVRQPPWAIVPLAFAPVIPGETLRSAHCQGRVVTDPLKSKLLGWWCEMHLFYVSHRTMDYWSTNSTGADWQNLVLSGTALGYATVSGGGKATYRLHGRRDLVSECLSAVVNTFFRDQGDTAANFTEALTGLPLVKFGREDWMDSLTRQSDVETGDFNVDLNASGTITASEVATSLERWEWLRANNWTQATYEDWLASYGVAPAQAQASVPMPEHLRSFKAWTYPTNTVSQGTGAVSSAAVWSPEFSLEKSRRFPEPGFLLLVGFSRPKVYRRRQPGAAANLMDTPYLWLPATLMDDPQTSVVLMDTVSGAVPSVGYNTVVADMRDLFLHGDQLLSACPSVSGGDTIAAGGAWSVNGGATQLDKFGTVLGLTATTARPDYPLGTLAERQDIFVGQVNETSLVEWEGRIQFNVATPIQDFTPGQPARP